MNEWFRRFAHRTAEVAGSTVAFGIATSSVVLWALSGPHYHYSENWQLVINTSTTIITFLMVFVIQNAQNRDSRAIHLKLNELLKAIEGARTELVDLEEMSDEELEKMHAEFKALHEKLQAKIILKQE